MLRTRRRYSECPPLAAQPPAQTVYWLIAILLAVIAALVFGQSTGHSWTQPAFGEPGPGWMGGNGVYAMPGAISREQHGLYMLDTESGTVWCYEYLPAKRTFQLTWARSYRSDRYLENFANEPDTTPAMINRMLEKQQQTRDRLGGALTPPADGKKLEDAGLNVPDQ